jgi:hypothetical protein
MTSLAEETVVWVVVTAPVEPEYWNTNQYSTLKNAGLLNWLSDAVVHVYFVAEVEPATLLVEVSQLLNRNVQVPRLCVAQDHTVAQIRNTGVLAVELAAFVTSNCQVPDWIFWTGLAARPEVS